MDITTFDKFKGKYKNWDDYYAQPGICVTLYSDKIIHELASSIADAMKQYLTFIGPDKLKWYGSASGAWKELKPKKISKDLKLLRDFPLDHSEIEIDYNQNGGVVEDYYLFFFGTDFKDSYYIEMANYLRLEFPLNILEQKGLDTFIDFVIQIAQTIPFQSGNIGYGFKTTTGSHDTAKKLINTLLPRYYGFDPCDDNLTYSMRDHILMAHWINLLNFEMADKIGGYETIKKALPGADVRKLKNGVFIRGAKWPPIGDINHRAPDIGLLPEVARLIKPLRVDLPIYFKSPWFGRFDELENRPWDNTEIQGRETDPKNKG